MPGLASDRAIHLRQEAGGDLDEPHAAPHGCGGKACKVANHTAAKSHDHIVSFDFLFQQPFHRPFEDAARIWSPLRAAGSGPRRKYPADIQPGAQSGQVQLRHVFLGYHRHFRGAAAAAAIKFTRVRQQPRADLDVICPDRPGQHEPFPS